MGEYKDIIRTVNDRIFCASLTAAPTEDVVRLVIHSQESDPDTREVLTQHTDSVSMRVDSVEFIHAWVESGGDPGSIMSTLEFLKGVFYLARAKARAVNSMEQPTGELDEPAE